MRPMPSCPSYRRKILSSLDFFIPHRRSYTRPPTAPKPHLDLKHIRQNPGLYEQNCIDRNYPNLSKHSWRILELHDDWLACQAEALSMRKSSKILNEEVAKLATTRAEEPSPRHRSEATLGQGMERMKDEAKRLKSALGLIEEKEKIYQAQMAELALGLPNLSSTNTPVGDMPEIIEHLNMPGNANTPSKMESSNPITIASAHATSHTMIGKTLDILDFPSAATTSGWGFYFLKGAGAMLETALVQHALSMATAAGFTLVSPPSMVYSHMAAACGFQPRDSNGETQIYAIEEKDPNKPGLVLAGTAEIPLAAMNAGKTLQEKDLPLKLVGVSRCYRAEAGARGADTKGLYRVHEFTKVELFAWTVPDEIWQDNEAGNRFSAASKTTTNPPSATLLDEMLALQKRILQPLGVPLRVLCQPTQDLGASATSKYDIEAFFPSREHAPWGELSSLSLCTDYQSRRLATTVKMARGGKEVYPYTLNGTALAVPRVLAAVLESGWDEETGSVKIPECLWPWMGGLKEICKPT
jgi:seryl-tRNA synthetase